MFYVHRYSEIVALRSLHKIARRILCVWNARATHISHVGNGNIKCIHLVYHLLLLYSFRCCDRAAVPLYVQMQNVNLQMQSAAVAASTFKRVNYFSSAITHYDEIYLVHQIIFHLKWLRCRYTLQILRNSPMYSATRVDYYDSSVFEFNGRFDTSSTW